MRELKIVHCWLVLKARVRCRIAEGLRGAESNRVSFQRAQEQTNALIAELRNANHQLAEENRETKRKVICLLLTEMPNSALDWNKKSTCIHRSGQSGSHFQILQAIRSSDDLEACQRDMRALETRCRALQAQVLPLRDQAEFDSNRCRRLEAEVST